MTAGELVTVVAMAAGAMSTLTLAGLLVLVIADSVRSGWRAQRAHRRQERARAAMRLAASPEALEAHYALPAVEPHRGPRGERRT